MAKITQMFRKKDLSEWASNHYANKEFICKLSDKDIHYFDYVDSISCQNTFMRCYNLEYLPRLGFSTYSCTDTSGMFYACYSLKSVDISNMDFTNISNMTAMFTECKRLKYIYGNLNSKRVCFMESMFEDCRSLTEIDFTKMDTSHAYKMGWLFSGCISLKKVHGVLDLSKCIHYKGMLNDCVSLSVTRPMSIRLPESITREEFIKESQVPDKYMVKFVY